MWLDVSELIRFYQTPLGQVARRLIRRRIRAVWPDLSGRSVLAVGFGAPYLRPFLGEAERVVALMPAGQGASQWPVEGPCHVALGDESELPFPDTSFDRVLLVHAFEFSEQLRPMLREAWRVLAGGGRLLVVAPNRRGLWSRLERTPFGHGHTFSQHQLDRVLRDCLFLPTRATSALYLPPTRRRFWLRFATAWEGLGERWTLPFAGVLVTEAEKQVYAATALRVQASARRRPLGATRDVALPRA